MQAIADLYEKKRMEACNMLELYVTLVKKLESEPLDSVPAAFREKGESGY